MDFFGAQDSARRRAGWLLLLFGLGATGLVILTSLLLMFVLGLFGTVTAADPTGTLMAFDGRTFAGFAILVTVVIAAGSLYKMVVLSRGGAAVAEALGGRLIAPDTDDPEARRVLNLVEEMAIASGTPVPTVYVLEGEAGINAFAAGLTPATAVIGLTRGAVEGLSRDQLQGVIGHEFSHILNGDMRLNIRLAGLLHGILLIGLIGRGLVQAGGHGAGRRGRDSFAFMLVGAGLVATGAFGTLFANLIKAAVSRQREFLADASAVQFTRNPQGIAGALKRIGAASHMGLLVHPRAPEMSHAYFTQGVSSFLGRLVATHPPLERRIRRLEPGWNGRFEETPRAAEQPPDAKPRDPSLASGLASPTSAFPAAAIVTGLAEATQAAIAQIGRPDETHLRYAHALIGELHPTLRWAAREPYGAQALVFALLLDRDAAIHQRQIAHLENSAEVGPGGGDRASLYPPSWRPGANIACPCWTCPCPRCASFPHPRPRASGRPWRPDRRRRTGQALRVVPVPHPAGRPDAGFRPRAARGRGAGGMRGSGRRLRPHPVATWRGFRTMAMPSGWPRPPPSRPWVCWKPLSLAERSLDHRALDQALARLQGAQAPGQAPTVAGLRGRHPGG
jgi:Zn-dependent protease with chaperone function